MHKRKGREGREARQERAKSRQAVYASLSNDEKILSLQNREKVGLNCTRERTRMIRQGIITE